MPIAPDYLHLVYGGPFTAYLYNRASRDPKKKGRSVGDQRHEGRDLCARHEWPIAGEFEDVNRSASRHAKRERDEFEEMIAGIEAGNCRIVVAWEASRYYRDLEAYVRLRNVCHENRVLLCYNGTVYDLSKREDRKATAMDAIQAEDEAEGIRDRNLRTVRLNAEKGRPHGPVLDGYKRTYDPESGDLIDQIAHPERAPIIGDIFQRAAGGESIRSIRMRLNGAGVTTQHGKAWEDWHLRSMLRNPGYVGRRIFQGKDIGEATWPPLVDEETFYAVQAVLDTPGRNTAPDTQVRHLLTNLALCGEHPDEPPLRLFTNRGLRYIGCSTKFDTTLRENRFDAYVEQGVLRWLSSDAAREAFERADDDTATRAALVRLQQMTEQLEEAQAASTRFDASGRPELSIATLAGIEARLAPQIEQARAESESSRVPQLVRDLVGNPDVEDRWEDLLMPQRRFVLRHVVTVRLFKARSKGVRTIEPGRITLSYFGQPGFKN